MRLIIVESRAALASATRGGTPTTAALNLGASVLISADDALCEAGGRNGMHVANPLLD